MNWHLDARVPVKTAFIELTHLEVKNIPTAFERLVDCAADYHDRYQWASPGGVPGVQHARHFFRAIGLDPTKRRPSSEALLNRAIKRKELYSINTLVDVGNWCSLDFLLPTCIYDADKIQGDVTIRLGRSGEHYLALNNREIEFEDRFVLVDAFGPFGSPMTDSQRTAVTLETKNAVLGIWAPETYDDRELFKQAELFAERAVDHCGGTRKRIEILK